MSNIPNFNQPPVSDIVNYTFYPWNYISIVSDGTNNAPWSERPVIGYAQEVSDTANGNREYKIVVGQHTRHSRLELIHTKNRAFPYSTKVDGFDDSIETGIFGWINPKRTLVEAYGTAIVQTPNGTEEQQLIVDKVMKTLRMSSLALAIVMAKLGSTEPVSDWRPTKGSFELPSEYVASSAALCAGRARQGGPANRRQTIIETNLVMPAIEAAKYI